MRGFATLLLMALAAACSSTGAEKARPRESAKTPPVPAEGLSAYAKLTSLEVEVVSHRESSAYFDAVSSLTQGSDDSYERAIELFLEHHVDPGPEDNKQIRQDLDKLAEFMAHREMEVEPAADYERLSGRLATALTPGAQQYVRIRGLELRAIPGGPDPKHIVAALDAMDALAHRGGPVFRQYGLSRLPSMAKVYLTEWLSNDGKGQELPAAYLASYETYVREQPDALMAPAVRSFLERLGGHPGRPNREQVIEWADESVRGLMPPSD